MLLLIKVSFNSLAKLWAGLSHFVAFCGGGVNHDSHESAMMWQLASVACVA